MITDAISHIPAHDRDVWVRMAMAVKSELGESGFEVWDQWSRQDESYKPADARAVWRSVKSYGGITIAALYAEARRWGWRGNESRTATVIDRSAIEKQQAQDRRRDQAKLKNAVLKAQQMLSSATLKNHDYLERKGFPEQQGLVLSCQLLIPMRDCNTGTLTGMQTIMPWGEKKFIYGSRAKGAVFPIGQGFETYLCEGYATALSMLCALKTMHRQARVLVTFSAANLAYVAGQIKGKRYVVADHDESGTGERYAVKTGLPYWMPPDTDQDANDFHLSAGVKALANELSKLRNGDYAS